VDIKQIGGQVDPVAPIRFERYNPTWNDLPTPTRLPDYKKPGVGLSGYTTALAKAMSKVLLYGG